MPQWSLSEIGIARMQRFCSRPEVARITSIYSSNETKARETADILANRLALSVSIIEALHENDRSSTGFLPPSAFQKMADRFFTEADQSVEGWERAVDAQTRITRTVKMVVETGQSTNRSAGDIAVISHGGVGALLMCHLLKTPISRRHEQPGNGGGNFFLIELADFVLIDGWHDIVAD